MSASVHVQLVDAEVSVKAYENLAGSGPRIVVTAGEADIHLDPDDARKMATEVLAACADLTGRHDHEVPMAFEVRP